MGHARLDQGDVDGAMSAFLDAIASDPRYVPALLSRLEILALHRENHIGAVAAGQVLRERGVGGVVMASALSYSLSAIGDTAEALAVIYAGLRDEPRTETLWYNAACLHAKLGQTNKAEIALSAAVRLLPANGAAARTDEDFERFRDEAWFLGATDAARQTRDGRTAEQALAVLGMGEAP